ncbi:MAG TPA: ABC transporter permease subunit [Candidatus Kapabacteria bacterium]|nr:ABC transporter permease subunit [Candidatus Kapabacteria bacterium]
MRQFLAIIEETYREARSKKTLVGFFIFSSVIIIITFFVFQSSSVKEAMNQFQQTKMRGTNGAMASVMQVTVLDIFYTIISGILYFMTICIGVFATTGFITSQMEKGTIDILLSKPVPRWQYLFGRYIASLSIIAIEAFWFILGMWIVVSLSLGIWNISFLLSTVFIVLGYAGIYSIVVLISVLSRSSALSIIVGIGLFFISGLISILRGIESIVGGGGKSTLSEIAGIMYYVFPQASDMGDNMKNAILGMPIKWEPIGLILALSCIYLSFGIYAFSKKEF